MTRGNFLGKGRPIVKYTDTLRSSVPKTAEPIEMPFGLWARMGPMNHMLDGDPEVLKEFAMVTNFSLTLGYNFGCIIASDMLFDSRVGFRGQAIR